ncbi:MAG: hypothetical protein ACREBY_19770, partial [Polaromonas sp.]
ARPRTAGTVPVSGLILPFQGVDPRIAPGAFAAPTAVAIGGMGWSDRGHAEVRPRTHPFGSRP